MCLKYQTVVVDLILKDRCKKLLLIADGIKLLYFCLVELKYSNISVFNMMVAMNKPSRKAGSVNICIELIIFQLKCDGLN